MDATEGYAVTMCLAKRPTRALVRTWDGRSDWRRLVRGQSLTLSAMYQVAGGGGGDRATSEPPRYTKYH